MRLPNFLVPRRKYEVDESMALVKFGRAQLAVLEKLGLELMSYERSERSALAIKSKEFRQSTRSAFAYQVRKPILFFQWGRVPKDWELSFVDNMKTMESQGIPFAEVLSTDLPLVIGEAPSEVLMRWVGKGGRSQPKRFVKAVNEMFGKSGKRIIIGLENQLDPEKMLDARKEPEEPFQAVIDAIREADENSDTLPDQRENKQHLSHS